MIITITDHFAEALAALAESHEHTNDLHNRVTRDRCSQPAALVLVDKETLTNLLVQLSQAGHVTVTEGLA